MSETKGKHLAAVISRLEHLRWIVNFKNPEVRISVQGDAKALGDIVAAVHDDGELIIVLEVAE